MSYDLTIVIVTHNSAGTIGDLIASIPDAVGALACHVTVVDNGSTDHTRALLGAIPVESVLYQGNRGYAAGINTGVRASPIDSKAILVLNADVVLRPTSIE